MPMYLVETDRPDPVPIEDLKLVVHAGVDLWITWEQKRASTCLRRLEALGHVSVSQGERSRVEKAPPKRPKAQHVRLSRPQRRPPPQPEPQTFTKADMEAAVADAATKASQQTASLLMEQMRALMPQAAPAAVPPASAPLDTEAIEVAVKKALEGATFAAPSGTSSSRRSAPRDPDEPMFIPEGIVGNDDTDLNIEAESTEDAGLTDAAAQLKKLRKRKKKE